MGRTVRFFAVVLISLSFLPAILLGEAQRKILSPRDSVFLTLGKDQVSVNYGRPSIRGRVIMGGLVPWHKVWRTGANEATHFRTTFDMRLGNAPVMKGIYTLWTIPGEDRWTIVVNKQTGQWGTVYNEGLDLARFEVKPQHLDAVVDTFTIALEATGERSGMMKLMWEHTLVAIPFEADSHIRPLSPGDSTEVSLGGHEIKIRYSSPFMRGRKIWGSVVPFDSVWRTGANAATLLTTDADLSIGAVSIPKGSYTLYSIPTADALTLIVSTKPAGPAQYDPARDLARIQMKLEKPETTIDPFRIRLEPTGPGAATLRIGWADRVFVTEVHAR